MAPNTFSFSEVLKGLRQGGQFKRLGWNGKGQFIEMQVPSDSSKMTLPYIFFNTAENHFVPWVASQTDLLAEDWTEA